MNNKQKYVMWSAIFLAIVCLAFPYVDGGGTRVTEVLEATNPQYRMSSSEWEKYRSGYNTDGNQVGKPNVPDEYRKSGRYLYPAVSGSGEWGYWYFYQPHLRDQQTVTLERKEPTNVFRFLFSEISNYSDIIVTIWFVEMFIIALIARGLWVQFRDDKKK